MKNILLASLILSCVSAFAAEVSSTKKDNDCCKTCPYENLSAACKSQRMSGQKVESRTASKKAPSKAAKGVGE